jgi:hypothetical protein
MVIHVVGVGDMPADLSSAESEELEYLERHIQCLKREKQREIDHLDTELIGVKEELRKRREQELAERTFRNAFIED